MVSLQSRHLPLWRPDLTEQAWEIWVCLAAYSSCRWRIGLGQKFQKGHRRKSLTFLRLAWSLRLCVPGSIAFCLVVAVGFQSREQTVCITQREKQRLCFIWSCLRYCVQGFGRTSCRDEPIRSIWCVMEHFGLSSNFSVSQKSTGLSTWDICGQLLHYHSAYGFMSEWKSQKVNRWVKWPKRVRHYCKVKISQTAEGAGVVFCAACVSKAQSVSGQRLSPVCGFVQRHSFLHGIFARRLWTPCVAADHLPFSVSGGAFAGRDRTASPAKIYREDQRLGG